MANQDFRKELPYQEAEEISIGEKVGWTGKLFRAFPAFQSKNYQYYFWGQLISLIGTWLQIVAEGWLVLQLTNSPFLIGLVSALALVPSLLFSLFGGVIVDRFPKKHILLVTQYSAMILALLYGLLTVFHVITIWEIMVLAFLLGVVNAIDIPARQSFVVEMVGKEGIASAVAINAGVFNAARVVGPAVAGLLIAVVGSGGAFIINGISYGAAIFALYKMHVQNTSSQVHNNPFVAIKEGISYAFAHPIIRTLLLFTGIVSIFGWSYSAIMPFIAKNNFHLDAAGLGYLYAISGLGALGGTFIISAFSKKFSQTVFIIGGSTLFALGMFAFTLVHTAPLAGALLFIAGIGLITQFATINTTMQHLVEDHMRGRVMSLYALSFLGLSPFGNFEIGFLSEHVGPSRAIEINISVVFVFIIYLYFSRNKIREKHKEYKKNQK